MNTYSIQLKCGTVIDLIDLEQTGISYVPCGQVKGEDRPLLSFGHLWDMRKQVTRASYGKSANAWALSKMTGVQLMTGEPSFRSDNVSPDGYVYLTDIDVEARLIEKYPTVFEDILSVYRGASEGKPCEIETKSGGRRLSAYAPYLDHKRYFRDKIGSDDQKTMLLEFFSRFGLSRLDHRYKILTGSILALPRLPKEALKEIHALISEVGTENSQKNSTNDAKVVERSQIGSLEINWHENGKSQYFPASHCQATSHKNRNRLTVQFFQVRDGVLGRCYNCSENWWEKEPTEKSRTAPIRLSVSEYERGTESIETQQEKITSLLINWEQRTRNSDKQHLLNITTAAGTRKTTVTVQHFDRLLYIAKTVEEADQAFMIADALERDVWRHRPRMYKRDHEKWNMLPLGLGHDERPCIHPETCNTLAERGYAPVTSFCRERCEVYARCQDVGFLAQTDIERNKRSVFLSWNEAFFSDEQFRSRVHLILNKEKMLVLDEADPAGLPQHRQFDVDELRKKFLEAWRLPNPKAAEVYTFLKTLIETLSTAEEPEQIRDAITSCVSHLTDTQIKTLDKLLSKIPLGVIWNRSDEGLEALLLWGNVKRRVFCSDKRQPPDGYDGTIPTFFAEDGVEIDTLQLLTVSLDVFDRAGFLQITKDPERSPRRFTSLVKDLKTFVETGSTACYRDVSVINFYLPPGLNAPRGITLTASDKDNLIREVYSHTQIEVETLQGLPPPFKEGCQYFQIATGRYTAKSTLLEKQDGAVIGAFPILQRMIDVILKTADTYKVLVVAPKDVLNAELDPRIEKLHLHPTVEVINHHHAEGRNDFQHCDVVFVFHFEPRPDEIEKIARRIYRNETLNFDDRQTTDVVVDGVTLAGVNRYKDERVQKVYNRECESRHMQAMMRLRPMINTNKMIVSFSAEPVSRIPIPPVPFTLPEMETFIMKEAGDLAAFDTYLELKASRSIRKIAEQDGVSKSTAYRRTEKQRADAKSKIERRVLELHDQEYSIREISDELGISRGKVEGILRKNKVS